MNHEERITYFGETDSRGKKIKFGIKSLKIEQNIHMS